MLQHSFTWKQASAIPAVALIALLLIILDGCCHTSQSQEQSLAGSMKCVLAIALLRYNATERNQIEAIQLHAAAIAVSSSLFWKQAELAS